MNILVLGGAGFLGANLVRRCLAERNAEVTVLDSLDPHFHSSTDSLKSVRDRITFVQGDIRDERLLAGLVRSRNIIFNCAAQSSHPLSVREPLLDADINCAGNLKVLEAVRAHNSGARVVYISSSTVIGKSSGDVVDETHGENPLEIYSANKGVAEKYYRIYHSMHGLKTVVLRFANLYGPYGKPYPEFGFVNYFIHRARSNQDIQIFGAGDQTRNVMYVEDAADILWRAAQEPSLAGQTYFAAGDEHPSMTQIASAIVSVFGRGRVTHVDWPADRLRMEIGSVQFSSERLRAATGWRPRFDLAAGLARTRQILDEEG